ncbi:MAG: hypothetical protein PHF51_00795 [Candidatus ainarchaeum sp.]|nr:hypothetical protein [Candidatus ainarchaeum sp.]
MAGVRFKENAAASAFADGEKFMFSGKQYELLRIPNPLLKWLEGDALTPGQKEAYRNVLEALLPVRELTDRIGSRQLSGNAGEAIGWLGEALEAIPKTSANAELVRNLRIYVMFASHGISLSNPRDDVKYVPSFTRKSLRKAIESIGDGPVRSGLLKRFDANAREIFSAEPVFPGANVYRFRTQKDKKRFLRGLGPEYRRLQEELDSKVRESIAFPEAGTKEIARLSLEMMGIQAKALKKQLAGASCERRDDKNTIVFMSYDRNGRMTAETKTYEEEFGPELKEISRCFREAGEKAKPVSGKLSRQLALLSEAVLSGDYSQAEETWLRMSPADSLVDVYFGYPETYFTFNNRKGEYEFRLGIANPAPDPLLEAVKGDERFGSLAIVKLDDFATGGRAHRMGSIGKKLPSGPSPFYKDIIIANVIHETTMRRHALMPEFVRLPGGDLTGEDMKQVFAATVPSVESHEIAHIFGGAGAEHLLGRFNVIEECSAESNGAALAETIGREHRKGLMLCMAARGPFRMLVGLSGAHERTNIYITGRMLEEGAIAMDAGSGKLVVDVDKSVPVLKKIGEECLLLENPEASPENAKALLAPELKELEAKGGPPDLKAAAYMRAEAMFGDENIGRIAEILEPAADKIRGKPLLFDVADYLDDPFNKRV